VIPIAVTNYHVFQLTLVMIYAIALICLNLAEKILRFDRRRGEVGLETGRAGATWTAALLFAMNVSLSAQPGDWSAYGADKANTKYSALAQIDRANVRQLRIAWRWKSLDFRIEATHPNLRTWLFETTPVASNGILYTSTSMSQVAAIDGLTGKTLWVYDPKIYEKGVPPGFGFVHRGVALWPEGKQDRVLIATGDARLIALDAASGRPAPSFGDNGVVDLTQSLEGPFDRTRYHMTSPPIVCRGVIVVGSAITDYDGVKIAAPGDVRGYDARTGKLIWTFHSVPMPGEFGAETWERGTNKGRRGVSVWAPLSADEQFGYVYLPFSSASNDYYGGERPGLNLFGESLVCLNVRTGTRVWHYQLVHHGLWDYDLPAAPTLADVTISGKRVPVVVQVTKQGFCFVFDRRTGDPVWPIEERPVPTSSVPGEKSAATQPHPTRPKPFDRQGATTDDLIDFTPELRQKALDILTRYEHGPLFTPPSFKGTLAVPGAVGGASWAGAAFDPETGRLFVPSATIPSSITVSANADSSIDPYSGRRRYPVEGPEGLPLFKPPFGRISAIDLSTGEYVWMVPSGDGPRNHPALRALNLPRLGWPERTFVLATRTLLFTGQEGPYANERLVEGRTQRDHTIRDPKLRAYDKANGELLAEHDLPANATGSPMTYLAGGKQFVVVAVGGSNLATAELVALTLP
jgi:glucose dehydrogenase